MVPALYRSRSSRTSRSRIESRDIAVLRSWRARSDPSVLQPGKNPPFEIVDLLLDLIHRLPVALLQHADQLVAFAGDHVEIVIGQLAPSFPHPAAHFGPAALYF